MTKIVSLIQRPGGTHVDMGSKKYHFKPEVEGGRHIADVTDEGHLKRFLKITEGYCLLGDEDAALSALAGAGGETAPKPKEDPAKWNNKKAFAYAKEVLEINPQDKNQILELAKKHGVELDESKAPAAMIRALVTAIGVEDDEEDDGADTDLPPEGEEE